MIRLRQCGIRFHRLYYGLALLSCGLALLLPEGLTAQTWLKKKAQEKPRFVIAGSVSCKTTFLSPFAHLFARQQKWDVRVYSGGSEAGIEAVYTGVANLALATRRLTAEERTKGLQDSLIAYDAIAVVVHKNNPVTELSIKDLHRILRGKDKSWKQFGWVDQPVTVVLPDTGSGLRKVFLETILEGNPLSIRTREALSTYGTVAALRQDSLAITICSLSQVRYAHLKALKIEGIPPSIETVADGSYPLRVPIVIVSRTPWEANVELFASWLLHGPPATRLAQYFYVPERTRPERLAE